MSDKKSTTSKGKFSLSKLRIPVKFLPIIIILEAALLVFLGYLIVLKPKYEAIKRTVDLGGRSSLLKTHQDYLKNLEDLDSILNNFDPTDFQKVENALPLDEDLPGLFVQLEYLAKASNMQLPSIAISDQELSEEEAAALPAGDFSNGNLVLKKKNIQIALEGGDYEQLKDFLREVEANIRILNITSINFGGLGSYNVTMETYYLGKGEE